MDAELYAVFLPEARGHLERLRDPRASDEDRRRAAHGLKGACAMVGLDALAKKAAHLEELLAQRAPYSTVEEILTTIARTLDAPAPSSEPDSPDWDPDELRGLRAFFLDEAAEHLEAIDEGVRALEKDGRDPAALGAILRKLHTFKGSAGSVLLTELSQRAHAFEDQVIALGAAGVPVEGAALAALEAGAAELRALLSTAEREVRGGPPPSLTDPPADPPARDRRLLDRRLDPDAQTVRVEVQRIDELMDAASELVFDRTRIARRQQELDGCVRDVAKVRGSLASVLADLEQRAPETAARLGEIATELGDVIGSLTRATAGAAEDAEGLQRTSATLQEGIRRVRMMAIGRLFARLDQPVRDLARREGKQVRVLTFGEETEIDKAVVERVSEPLLHLLRNAIAHGIEPPAARRALGKPESGTITVTASHEGDAIEVAVEDDGRGIDLAAVRSALATSHRLSAKEAAALDEPSLYATLFQPGVSTRVGADDLAGRGVGLDAVKEAIARLGGAVRVTSTPGRGARFVVRLPLTTAVQQALLFKVGGQVYAVPAARVVEAVQVSLGDLRPGPDRERVALPDGAHGVRELPLVRLGALLGVPAPPGQSRRAALILTVPGTPGVETFAMTCDKVIGPREIVVRSLGPLLAALPLYAGATISGAGKVQLILDVAHLAEHARRGVRAVRPTRALGPRRVLVADDSRAIREAASLILAQGGYSVESVSDGWDAWELLQDRPFDLLITDLEMPRLDGHELIGKIRRTPELEGLPILVLTSRTSDAMRSRVAGEGADGFVPKPVRRKPLLDALESALRPR